mgnify:CR=1 FL=1
MRLPILAAIGVLAAACGGDKGEVVDTGPDGPTTDPRCANAVLDQYPVGGESDVFVRSSVDVTLSQPDTSATIVVTDASGAEVPGTVSLLDDDKRVEWLPVDALDAGADYTATLNWACEAVVVDFGTGSVGSAAVADPSGLVDRGYTLDLKDGRFVAPDGIGAPLQSLLEVRLLLGVTAVDATTLSLRAGAEDAKAGAQDLAASTTDLNPATFADPYFEVSQELLPLVIEGDPIDVTDLTISGSFASDGSSIDGFRLSGVIDTRDLTEAVGVEGPDGVCNLFSASFNVQCQDCPNGEGTYCINLVVADLPLPETGYPVVEVN